MSDSQHISNNAVVTADELYDRISEILNADSVAAGRMLHEMLVLICSSALRDTGHAYGNLTAQVDALCRRCRLSQAETAAMHRLRRDTNRRQSMLNDDVTSDCGAMTRLVEVAFGVPVPQRLSGRLPDIVDRKPLKSTAPDYYYIRCVVRSWDDNVISVTTDDDLLPDVLTVRYVSDDAYADFSYLRPLLRTGRQLNLLKCREEDGCVSPQMIVVEPDYVVDISSLAACFEDYGHHPLQYMLNKMRPRVNTRHTILGNFAGRALDSIINDDTITPAGMLKDSFREKALEYATCEDFDAAQFKEDAARQITNIRGIVNHLFAGQDRSSALLEPSFVCERLGLYGRVDLMTSDKHLLVEQKSGKNIYLERGCVNRYGSRHIEKHYVQVLLYHGILEYNFGLSPHHVNIRLLYSKYPLPTGLMEVSPLQKLLREALKLRNEIVAWEYKAASEGFHNITEKLTPQTLNTEHADGYFFNRYLLPQIMAMTEPLKVMPDLERAYFNRMMTFVMKEQLLAKVGTRDGQGNSTADLWNMSLDDKRESGNIFTNLTVVSVDKTIPTGGYDLLTLRRDADTDFLPNFRVGDMVYLYSYDKDCVPDVRRSILYKGVLAELSNECVIVQLSDGQRNRRIFSSDEKAKKRLRYAIEHASGDGSSAVNSLHSFISAPDDRRQLLLGEREPRCDKSVQLTHGYNPSYDGMLLKAMQATDYFLLIGPPGTGKTSMALRYIVEEQLASCDKGDVLIMSYTNRAVDEICAMLCDAGIDFVRQGNEYSCAPQFRPYLIGHVAEKYPQLDGLRQRLKEVRVMVATTSTMMSRPFIFNLKHFALAIVDEAGQITEPNIIGLLSAHRDDCVIDKFILVGDYKQLPAVVRQDAADAAITDPLLRHSGFESCADSLFERLVRTERRAGRADFVEVLNRQGRMHPDVAEFPNSRFYHDEHIVPVPLRHQTATSIGYSDPAKDAIDEVLKSRRMIFIPSASCSDAALSEKVNTSEARIVADVVMRLRRLFGTDYDPDKSVGVIVPYRNQIAMIRSELEKSGFDNPEQVCIDTVERFQGSQRDVIIYSFTIHRRYQLEFLTANRITDEGRLVDRKLNVVLTRARKQLIMTGNPAVVAGDPLFAGFIQYVKNKDGMLNL